LRTELIPRRELALVAAALLLPIPLLAASGLMLPLPSAVERALVSLLPGGEVETRHRGGLPVSTSSRSLELVPVSDGSSSGQQDFAGVLSEGGNATAPAGKGAAGGDDSAADNVLPGDERLLPGGDESDLPAAPDLPTAPDTPVGPSSTDDGAGAPAGGARSPSSSPIVLVSPQGVTVDTPDAVAGVAGATVDVSPEDGVTLTVDTDEGETNVTVPLSLPTLPLP
jgi:hypothetical protein